MKFEKKLFQLFPGVQRADPEGTKLSSYNEDESDIPLPYPLQTLNRLIGLEFEIENCSWSDADSLSQFFLFERDSSLRGEDAYELKTSFPTRTHQGLKAICALYETIEKMREQYGRSLFSFSERTSTHIHVDVRDLTLGQLRSVLRLYLVFERAFFELIGRDRQDNVFCIPLSQAAFMSGPVDIGTLLMHDINSWEKYCAVNIQCLPQFGTIEFRGMGGTNDGVSVSKWLYLTVALVEFCKQNPEESIKEAIRKIKYESQYEALAKTIFGDLARTLTYFPQHMDAAASLCKFII